METVADAVGKLWFLGAEIVAIAAYAVTKINKPHNYYQYCIRKLCR